MHRRRLLLAVSLVALLGVAPCLYLWLTSPNPGVSLANFRRLQRGISLWDVKALLGEPHVTIRLQSWGNPGEGATTRCWRDAELAINLTFNAGDTLMYGIAFPQGDLVNHVPAEYFPRAEESLLDRIRRWLRL